MNEMKINQILSSSKQNVFRTDVSMHIALIMDFIEDQKESDTNFAD